MTLLGDIEISRNYFYDKKNKTGFFPIEENYPILKSTYFPEITEMVCFTATLEPYACSRDVLKKLSNINISTSEIQKITKNIGEKLVEIENDKISESNKYIPSKKKIEKMAISMDGAMANTNEGWKEVKSGVIYNFRENNKILDINGNPTIESFNKSYISRIEDYSSFGKRLKQEAKRRNYRDAKQLIVIADGAKWIWELAKKDYPFATQIVDWYHAKEHLSILSKLFFAESSKNNFNTFFEKLSDLLFEGKIDEINDIAHNKIMKLNIADDIERLKSIHTELEYFNNNKKRMQYKYFKSKGFPIGSGVIEATCKQLVQLRLKRNGMKWKKPGAHCILQLRCHYLSGRWNEVEELIKPKAA